MTGQQVDRKTAVSVASDHPAQHLDDDDEDEYDDAGFLSALAAMPLTPRVAISEESKQAPRSAASTSKLAIAEEDDEEDEVLPMTQWNLADLYPGEGGGTKRFSQERETGKHPLADPPLKKRKVARFESFEDAAKEEQEPQEQVSVTRDGQRPTKDNASTYLESSAYEAIRFGEFGRYMKNKRAKLKVQEASLKEQEEALLSAAAAAAAAASNTDEQQADTAHRGSSTAAPIASPPALFKDCTMYITGHTNPPYAELRRLIVLHGGDFMAYLDQKSPVTHIIASNLTPKKRVEFQAYRVARPEWITESIKAGKRLPWTDFKVESDAGGAMGVEKLPSGRTTTGGQQQDSTKNAFLVDAFTSRAATASSSVHAGNFLAGSRPDLVDANPWGRASAQRKLAGFQPRAQPCATHKGQSLQEGTSLDQRKEAASSTHIEQTVSTEKQRAHSELHAGDRPNSPESPSHATPPRPTDTQLTAEETEWLGSLETPPKGKGKAREVDDAGPVTPTSERVRSEETGTGTPSSSAHSRSATTPVTPVTPITPSKRNFESAIGTDPVSRVAAQAAGHHDVSHPYAKRPSNMHAAKLLASPSWRERNTATSESFLSGFFAKSRLHYLSTWKGELRDLVSQALKDTGRQEGSQALPKGVSRVIMHVDFDSFFVSVGLRDRPDLVDQPVVVCHAGSAGGGGAGLSSTSEIASCNYVARKFGVHNGWSLGRARQVCPKVQTIPYDFEAYKNISIDFYSLMLMHADAIEAVSVDEALIDVSRLLQGMRGAGGEAADEDDEERTALINAYRHHTSSQGEQWTEEKQLAEALRDEIRRRTRCEASIGIGSNTLLARLATRHAKPGGSYHLKDGDVVDFTANLDVDELQGVGYSTRQRFQNVFGTANVGQLRQIASQSRFCSELGPKLGKQVWDKMHGNDRAELEGAKQRQSVGAAVNYGIRFQSQDEAEKFMRNLAQEVSNRLTNYALKGRQVNVTVMVRDPSAPVEAPKFLGHGICDVHNRSSPLGGNGATHDVDQIFKAAWKLVKGLNAKPEDLRGIAISCTKLEPVSAGGTSSVPVKPKGGQSLLNFQVTPKKTPMVATMTMTPSSSKLRLPPVSAVDSDDDDEEMDDELQAGPLSSLPRQRQTITRASRSPSPIRHHGKATTVDTSRTAVDTSRTAVDTSRAAVDTSRTAVDTSRTAVETSRTAAVDTSRTPARAQSAEPMGTQTKEITPQSNVGVVDSLGLPTMSQLDQSVLKELPASIRAEVLRESKRLSAKGGNGGLMTRSLSASPSSSRIHRGSLTAFLGVKTATKKVKPTMSATLKSASSSGTASSSSHHHRKMAASNAQQLKAQQPNVERAQLLAMDPSQVTESDLRSLEIDPEVFAALPLSVQRETLLEQSATIKGRSARFITTHSNRNIERSIASERRLATDRAALNATGGDEVGAQKLYRAVPHRSMEEIPHMQKKTTTAEIQSLLTRWISTHRNQKPRTNDVLKFAQFLIDTMRTGTRATSISTIGQMDKVQELLIWWRLELERIIGLRGGEEEDDDENRQKVRRGWWDAFDRVKADVDGVLCEIRGYRVSLMI